ncbi:G-protein coupled receptor [Fusarium oxysporum f. sp. albedinis]|nr:G-protein coupled receptor [Fusarium oxysporum f. sp. albedinis]
MEIYNRDVRVARYFGRAIARMALCDLAELREGLENLAIVLVALCEVLLIILKVAYWIRPSPGIEDLANSY